jgi:hypothetical protein
MNSASVSSIAPIEACHWYFSSSWRPNFASFSGSAAPGCEVDA